MTVELPLYNSDKVAIVDDDCKHLLDFKWRLGQFGFVYRASGGSKDRCGLSRVLHKNILQEDRSSRFVCRMHIDRDKLNNQRSNLTWIKHEIKSLVVRTD